MAMINSKRWRSLKNCISHRNFLRTLFVTDLLKHLFLKVWTCVCVCERAWTSGEMLKNYLNASNKLKCHGISRLLLLVEQEAWFLWIRQIFILSMKLSEIRMKFQLPRSLRVTQVQWHGRPSLCKRHLLISLKNLSLSPRLHFFFVFYMNRRRLRKLPVNSHKKTEGMSIDRNCMTSDLSNNSSVVKWKKWHFRSSNKNPVPTDSSSL